MTIKILHSKALPDGTVVTAIEWGAHVILLHQEFVDVLSDQEDAYPRYQKGNIAVQVQMYSRATKIITREEFDDMNYERHMANDPKLSSPVLQIEDRSS